MSSTELILFGCIFIAAGLAATIWLLVALRTLRRRDPGKPDQ